jgi:predicted small secreted protein
MIKKIHVQMAVVLAVLMMAGCNTMQGLGKDLSKAGEAIEKKAKE